MSFHVYIIRKPSHQFRVLYLCSIYGKKCELNSIAVIFKLYTLVAVKNAADGQQRTGHPERTFHIWFTLLPLLLVLWESKMGAPIEGNKFAFAIMCLCRRVFFTVYGKQIV